MVELYAAPATHPRNPLLRSIRAIAVVYLALVTGFVLGAYVMHGKNTWPYPLVLEILQFVEGHPEEVLGLFDKAWNDLDLKPMRQIVVHPQASERAYRRVDLQGANDRRDAPLLYISPEAERGYRLIFGPFDFADHLHGAILLDGAGEVVHTWRVTEQQLAWDSRPDTNKFPHGLTVRPDGSLLIGFDAGASIQRIDACGRMLWAIKSEQSHSIAPDGEDHVWAWRGHLLSKIEVETGALARSFSLDDIWRANPDIDILALRQYDFADRFEWMPDRYHPNDIEPLPAALADRFPQFAIGDLLVSLRSINLIFVVDPDSLKVKWWRMGPWRRQHDPDWQPDGRITVYDNNMHRNTSRIVAISPQTFETEVLADGAAIDFYSWNRGKHQILPGGHLLITVPGQGRVIELDQDGETVMEFVNLYDQDSNENLVVSEAVYLPEGFFEFEEFPICDPS